MRKNIIMKRLARMILAGSFSTNVQKFDVGTKRTNDNSMQAQAFFSKFEPIDADAPRAKFYTNCPQSAPSTISIEDFLKARGKDVWEGEVAHKIYNAVTKNFKEDGYKLIGDGKIYYTKPSAKTVGDKTESACVLVEPIEKKDGIDTTYKVHVSATLTVYEMGIFENDVLTDQTIKVVDEKANNIHIDGFKSGNEVRPSDTQGKQEDMLKAETVGALAKNIDQKSIDSIQKVVFHNASSPAKKMPKFINDSKNMPKPLKDLSNLIEKSYGVDKVTPEVFEDVMALVSDKVGELTKAMSGFKASIEAQAKENPDAPLTPEQKKAQEICAAFATTKNMGTGATSKISGVKIFKLVLGDASVFGVGSIDDCISNLQNAIK